VAVGDEPFGEVATDEARTAGDQNVHTRTAGWGEQKRVGTR
jgi:hypothetical protein